MSSRLTSELGRMLAAQLLHKRKLRRLEILGKLREAVARDNSRKRGALREGGRLDLNILGEEEWRNLFR